MEHGKALKKRLLFSPYQFVPSQEAGAIRERSDWQWITAWERLAEIAGNTFGKGTHALLKG